MDRPTAVVRRTAVPAAATEILLLEARRMHHPAVVANARRQPPTNTIARLLRHLVTMTRHRHRRPLRPTDVAAPTKWNAETAIARLESWKAAAGSTAVRPWTQTRRESEDATAVRGIAVHAIVVRTKRDAATAPNVETTSAVVPDAEPLLTSTWSASSTCRCMYVYVCLSMQVFRCFCDSFSISHVNYVFSPFYNVLRICI